MPTNGMLFLQIAGFVSLLIGCGSGVVLGRRMDGIVLPSLAALSGTVLAELFLIFFLGWCFT